MNQANPVCIVAEAGVNHNGSLEMALRLIDVAVEAGADVVKFQTFRADKEISRNAPKAEYQTKTTLYEESQFEMVKKLELDEQAHKQLIEHCNRRGIEFLSTPFDLESVDLLALKFNIPRLKLASGEITNAPLILKASRTGKPVILSTGMSTLEEIEMALGILAFGYTGPSETPSPLAFQKAYVSEEGQKALMDKVVLLHCTTEYPAPYIDINLRAMETLRVAFGLPVGFSDHTAGIAVSVAAAAMGAAIIEKHFTLDRSLPGPDHMASIEPEELTSMVRSIRQVEQALGSPLKVPAPSELKNIVIARKSIVAARSIKAGEVFSEENITTKRPGTGISPIEYWGLLGKEAERDYQEDEALV